MRPAYPLIQGVRQILTELRFRAEVVVIADVSDMQPPIVDHLHRHGFSCCRVSDFDVAAAGESQAVPIVVLITKAPIASSCIELLRKIIKEVYRQIGDSRKIEQTISGPELQLGLSLSALRSG